MALIKTIVLFDGACNLCNDSVDKLRRSDKKERFRYITLQSEEAKILRNEFTIPTKIDSIVLIHRSDVYTKSDAIIQICKLLPAPWKWLAVFRIIPKGLRDKIYRWVANNRYSWFGERAECRVV